MGTLKKSKVEYINLIFNILRYIDKGFTLDDIYDIIGSCLVTDSTDYKELDRCWSVARDIHMRDFPVSKPEDLYKAKEVYRLI